MVRQTFETSRCFEKKVFNSVIRLGKSYYFQDAEIMLR